MRDTIPAFCCSEYEKRAGTSLRSNHLGRNVALSMLPIYHRQYDARVLLLALPGCALLWSRRNLLGKLAFFVTALSILVTGDLSIAVLHYVTRHLSSSAADMRSNVLLLIVKRPAPLCLFAMSAFFLSLSACEFYRRLPGKIGNGKES